VFLALASCTFSVARADELRKASDNAHAPEARAEPDHEDEQARSRERRSEESESCDGDGGTNPLAALVGVVLLSPFWIPHVIVEGPTAIEGWSFAPSPYADGAAGYLRRSASGPDNDPPGMDPAKRRPVAFQVAFDGLAGADGSFGRVQASARILTTARFELDAAYGYYFERGAAGAVSSAWLGHGHLSYRFAQSEHVQFRAGAGVRHWIDARGSALGPDAVYAVDIAWRRPVTTSLEASAGYLGNAAWAGELRGTVGCVMRFAEIFAGYDGVWIGGPGPTAYLGGPIAGMRAYF
jgi:hypothetical protein